MNPLSAFLFLNYVLIAAAALNQQEIDEQYSSLSYEELSHVTSSGILQTILNNREFGSNFVKFSEWENPNGDLYVIPYTEETENSYLNPAMGLGYRFVDNNNAVVESLNINDVVKIEEENVTAAGFPFGWKKHEEQTADDFFPFGSKKFMMIGVNKESVNFDQDANSNHQELDAQNKYIKAHGLFNWFEEEDDCNEDIKTNKLFDTDHFLFVGVGSVDDKDMEHKENQNVDERFKYDVFTTSLHIVTEFTTTTVTSTFDLIVTNTVPTYNSIAKEPFIETHKKETVTTNEPFIFSTSEQNVDDSTQELTVTLTKTETSDNAETMPTNDVTDKQTNSYVAIETTENMPTEETAEITSSRSMSIDTVTDATDSITSWSIPTTWNSYPLSSSMVISDAPYINNTSSFISSLNSFQTMFSNSTRNTTTSKSFDNSIYTRTKPSNSSKMTTSENSGSYVHDWSSLFGIILAIISSVILI